MEIGTGSSHTKQNSPFRVKVGGFRCPERGRQKMSVAVNRVGRDIMRLPILISAFGACRVKEGTGQWSFVSNIESRVCCSGIRSMMISKSVIPVPCSALGLYPYGLDLARFWDFEKAG